MENAMKFRKRPVEIEAVQWDGDNTQEIMKWAGGSIVTIQASTPDNLTIETVEGDMRANKWDWIIKGVKGEFYPCKLDIFSATYDPA